MLAAAFALTWCSLNPAAGQATKACEWKGLSSTRLKRTIFTKYMMEGRYACCLDNHPTYPFVRNATIQLSNARCCLVLGQQGHQDVTVVYFLVKDEEEKEDDEKEAE